MKILITGGAGFIGSHLADKLINQGHDVIVYDNLDPQVHLIGWPDYLNSSVKKIFGDVRDKKFFERILKDYDVEVIFHFAAKVGVGQSMYEIDPYVNVNVGGTANLLDIIVNSKLNIKKLIVASSMSCYGEGEYEEKVSGNIPVVRSLEQLQNHKWDIGYTPIPTKETKPLESQSIYALSKKMQEEMCLSVGKTYNIPTTALRFFNIYGTRQSLSNPYTGVVAIFCSCFLNDQNPIIFEDGKQMRDFVHIDDITDACILSMTKDEANYETFNVSSGKSITVFELAKIVQNLMNSDKDPIISNKFRVGDIRHCFANIDKIKKLGYEPKHRLEEGLVDVIEWVKKQRSYKSINEMINKLSDKKLII